MFSKLRKVVLSLVLSIILCVALVPLAGLSLAWADEVTGGTDPILGQGEESEGTDFGSSDGLTGQDGLTEQGDPADQDGLTKQDGLTEQDDPVVLGDPDELSGENGDEPDGAASGSSSSVSLSPASVGVDLVPAAVPAFPYSVEYRTHVQDTGWQAYVADGDIAGTTGRSLRLEALNIRLNYLGTPGSELSGSIEYRTHVQNIGWQNWVADGTLSGTTGSALRAEAISIRLTDDLANAYNIYYRVHVQNFGWLGWATNGEDAGSAGYGYRMEAIEIRLVEKTNPAPGNVGNAYKKVPMVLLASAHVANVGWQAWVSDGNTAGTTGRALRVEAVRFQLANPDYAGSIEYRAHCAGIGWQTSWSRDGAIAGTTGQARQMEAIQIRLTGEMETKYDVYYRVHIQSYGWMGWAKNEESAGTVGLSCQIEALQVKLVPQGGAAPGSTTNCYFEASLAARANVAGLTWLPQVSGNPAVVGTTGQSRQMETFWISVSSNVSGSIEYSAYVASDGWQPWVTGDANAGTIGEGKRIEAIRIRLTGNLANYFDVYYRAHSASWGWLGWAKNGANAGTGKVNLSLEAFQVALVIKGASAPGTTYGAYWESLPIPATYMAMNTRIANMYSSTGWLIAIDTTNCLYGVYSGYQGNWTNRYMWLCSPGTAATPTIKGTYYVGSRGYVFGSGYSCYYWTQILGDYLMHSVLYYEGTLIFMEGTMGVPGSHGCVRLEIDNAKWIYDNIPTGTTIFIY